MFRPTRKIEVTHKENKYSDFDRDRLILQMSSNEGPAAAVGDVNGDGLDDLFLGGSKGESAQLLLQTSTGWSTQVFNQDINAEDVSAELIDIDQDGDLDLLVASGGHEFSFQNLQLRDRIYLNDGKRPFYYS